MFVAASGFLLGIGCEETGLRPRPPGEVDNFYVPETCEHTVLMPAEVAGFGFDDGVTGDAPAPDHIHTSWTAAPESSFAVNWRTDNATTATQLIYGTDQSAVEGADGPGDGVSVTTGHHLLYGSFLDGDTQTRVHEVHVCGLDADTTYYYKVGGPGGWSDVYDFATAPEPGNSDLFTFAVTGDSRNEVEIWAQTQAEIDDFGVDFQLFSGDAVVTGLLQAEWNNFFEATFEREEGDYFFQDTTARIPFMVVNGNHDALAINYVSQFALPQEVNGDEKATGEEWYSFDYANMHVVMLNDTPEISALGQDQRDWLTSDLASVDREETPWIIAVHHKPLYSCGGAHSSDLDLRAAWQPIFDQFKVDIVFAGHDHLYERTVPIRGLDGNEGVLADSGVNGVPVSESGTVYVVAAGAGAPLYGEDDSCAHTYTTKSVRNYVIVEIEDRSLRYRAYELGGTLLDEFDYDK